MAILESSVVTQPQPTDRRRAGSKILRPSRRERVEERADRRLPFLLQLAPEWGRSADVWVRQQSAEWRIPIFVFGMLVVLAGGLIWLGGGFTSIDGVRQPVARVLLRPAPTGLPAITWWLLPIANTFIQIVTKRLPWARWAWRGSMVFDGATTGVAVTFWLIRLLEGTLLEPTGIVSAAGFWDRMLTVAPLGVVGAIIGLQAALWAEQFFLAGLVLMRAGYKR